MQTEEGERAISISMPGGGRARGNIYATSTLRARQRNRNVRKVGLILLYTARASPATCSPEQGVARDVHDTG